MRRKGRRADAARHIHEDSAEARDYGFQDPNGFHWIGRETKTLCGHWFSTCDDDKERRIDVWRWDVRCGLDVSPDQYEGVTCPHCRAMIDADDMPF